MALVNLPTAAKQLRRKAKEPRCATPGKADLTVPQLESERDCYMGAEYKVRWQLNRLIDSTDQAAAAAARLAGRKKKRSKLASWLPASIRQQRAYSIR